MPNNFDLIIIGAGPAGIFTALELADTGMSILILEKGLDIRERIALNKDRQAKAADRDANIVSGWGGAGAFSDGKLTTGTGDARDPQGAGGAGQSRCPGRDPHRRQAPHRHRPAARGGAPHPGGDHRPGGEVRFSAKVTGIRSKAGQLTGLEVESRGQRETIECSQAILAVGHSARDVFQLLDSLGLPLQAKPFSVGARIEHPQSLIDTAQYGAFAGHPALGAADYKLSCHLKKRPGGVHLLHVPRGTR
mgnify:CR=1 FL=1